MLNVRLNTMKARLIMTLAMCVFHLVGKYFAARNMDFLTIMVIPPTSFVVGAFFGFGLFLMTVWNLVWVFQLWRTYRVKVIIPFLICLPFFFLGKTMSEYGLTHRIMAFKANLPDFQAKADVVIHQLQERGASPQNDEQSVRFGEHSGFKVYAQVDTNGCPTVWFLRIVTMSQHHLGYMCRPDGKLNSGLVDRMRIQAQINDTWCAVVD